MSTSLAERLKSETRMLHTQAERSVFMGVLLRGKMEQAAYCALLRNLHAIYAAMEPALVRHAAHPSIAPVFAPPLARTQALAADLDDLHGPGWHAALAVQPSGAQYVLRLKQLEADEPELLLAHAYVRYLGDLSGGQMLSRIVAQSMQLPAGQGTAFYDFGDASETTRLTRAFRGGLQAVAVGEIGVDAIVAEACSAFQRHQALFEELAVAHLR
ncbi:MAG: biliverdin-producing heme oxygenase [Burkholderiales bacterium]|nr:biliverdin-producing heme oxygenase [Burkholderiales bacterium]